MFINVNILKGHLHELRNQKTHFSWQGCTEKQPPYVNLLEASPLLPLSQNASARWSLILCINTWSQVDKTWLPGQDTGSVRASRPSGSTFFRGFDGRWLLSVPEWPDSLRSGWLAGLKGVGPNKLSKGSSCWSTCCYGRSFKHVQLSLGAGLLLWSVNMSTPSRGACFWPPQAFYNKKDISLGGLYSCLQS